MNTTIVLALGAAVMVLGGCSLTREQQIARKAERVESSLKSEQKRVLALPAGEQDRDWRLDHLTSLRLTLSGANIARAAVPYAVEEAQRPMAWDVLEEVYSTIDWNIPMGPRDQKRSLPAQFQGGTLKLGPR